MPTLGPAHLAVPARSTRRRPTGRRLPRTRRPCPGQPSQTCTAVPSRTSELTADEVTAAILADPAVAAALERTTA
ncbi:hypothetical protein ACFV0W_05190 [Streptomyces anulatus]